MKMVTQEDIDALQKYTDEKAGEFWGMSYAQGIQEFVDWFQGHGKRPDLQEEDHTEADQC